LKKLFAKFHFSSHDEAAFKAALQG
jgi:hypothetical protein